MWLSDILTKDLSTGISQNVKLNYYSKFTNKTKLFCKKVNVYNKKIRENVVSKNLAKDK